MTFKELYDEFSADLLQYTPELVITESVFMLWLTRAIRDFQKKTKLIRSRATLTRADTSIPFALDSEIMYLTEVADSDGNLLLPQSYEQQTRAVEMLSAGIDLAPSTYALKGQYPNLYHNGECEPRTYSVYGRELNLEPDNGDTELTIAYVPDLQAISKSSSQWEGWFTTSGAWEQNFQTKGIAPPLNQFESAFIDYALARVFKAKGSEHFLVYERSYQKAILEALELEHTYATEALVDYHMGPRS